MKASAFATLIWANRRAFSTSDRSCSAATVRAIWFQMPTPALVTPTPAQKKAISVCSGVRVAELMLPSSLTSSNAAVYSALVSAGGGPGRNWSPLSIANGVTNRHCGVAGVWANAGGVGRHWPGSKWCS